MVIVSSERSEAYSETAQALLRELERQGVAPGEVLQIDSADWPFRAPPKARLYISLGAQAGAVLARSALSAPVLCTLLPRSSYEAVLHASGRKTSVQFSALLLDQPVERQLELVRLALPAVRRVGVLRSQQATTEIQKLRVALQARDLQINELVVDSADALFPALRNVLGSADVLLAVPDSAIYNRNTLQNILLASFRAQVPLVAISPAYVRAGALLAVYVTPSQIGHQAAALAKAVLQGKNLPPVPVYSTEFEVAVNEHVARSFGLRLEPKGLRQGLRRRESSP